MPTIHREAGFVFRFFSDDHMPPHVHILGGNGAMKVLLGGEGSPPKIVVIVGMKKSDASKALRIVEANQDMFLQKWKEWHE